MCGGEGGIRTPGTLASTSDFESGAFNRALPPLRTTISLSQLRPWPDCPAAPPADLGQLCPERCDGASGT